MRLLAPLLAVLLLGAAAVEAQTRPPHLRPVRDVAVTYRVLGASLPPGASAAGGAPEMVIGFLAAEERARVDMGAMMPGLGGWGLTDLRTGRVSVVIDSARMVMDNPPGVDATRALRLAEEARLTRQGPGRYAGEDCVAWRWENQGERGTVCLTAEGVMLRAVNERGQGIEAVRVSHAPQDPARFRVPAGYRQVSAEEMARGLSGLLGLAPRR